MSCPPPRRFACPLLDKTPPQTPPCLHLVHSKTTQNIDSRDFAHKISGINILPPHLARNLLISKI